MVKCLLMMLLILIGSGCAGGVMRDFCTKYNHVPKTKEFREWVVYNMPPKLKEELVTDIGNSHTYQKFCK